MNTIFVLILLFIQPGGELVIAQDDDIFPTAVACQKQAEMRVEEAGNHVLWISTACAEVPKNPAAKQTRSL